ncbi:MAG: cell division protein FtsB [Myxococcota bacterium]|jgi:cell division protein FtsB
MPPLVRRLVFNIFPLMLVVSAISYTLAGEEGLLNRSVIKQQLLLTQQRVHTLHGDNDQLRARIRSLREDPDAVRRVAAEQLLIAEPGSTIYLFSD